MEMTQSEHTKERLAGTVLNLANYPKLMQSVLQKTRVISLHFDKWLCLDTQCLPFNEIFDTLREKLSVFINNRYY